MRLGTPAAENSWLSRLLNGPSRGAVAPGEVYGTQRFDQPLGPGWTFSLVPDAYGWAIRVYSADPEPVDLSAITPPFSSSVPNPRQLAGWHFRNATNTGPNDGSVNAPQNLRLFAFDPRLAGTGGLKPPRTGDAPPDSPGRGWLRVLDSGLADLEQGKQARLTYLRFDGCLRWPRATQQSTVLDESDLEMAGSCGIDLTRFDLVAADLVPVVLQGDLDGDGAFDHVYRLREQATGNFALALCRAGTWLSLLESRSLPEVTASTIQSLERWQMLPKEFAQPGSAAVGNERARWPAAAGDVLALERMEKSLVLVYWLDGLQVQPIFRVASE